MRPDRGGWSHVGSPSSPAVAETPRSLNRSLTYYRLDNTRLSFGECWRIGGRLGWLLCLWKLFGKRVPLGEGLPEPRPIADTRIEESEVDAEERASLAPLLHEAA